LAHGGVKFMHMGCNWPSGYVHDLPSIFWWEGPDGSRVLTMYSSIYGTSTAFWPWGGKTDPNIGQNLLPPPNWLYKTWVAIIVTGLPVVKGEMPDTWIHGCMSDPGGMRLARNTGPLLPVVEALNTQLRLWGVSVADPSHDIARAYEQSLLYNEHTWGRSPGVRHFGDDFQKTPPRLIPARAAISSLVEKRTGRDWVNANAKHGLGEYLNERFDKAQTDGYCRDYQQGRWGNTLHPGMSKPGLPTNVPYRAASSHNGTLKIARDDLRTIAIMDLPGDPPNHLPATSLRVTLYRGLPYLDLELTIKDKAKDNWPEADWLCLPFKVHAPQFRVGRNLGTMDPATDILRGANRNMYAVGTGVTLTDADGAGISLCPLDHPLVSLDTPGCWRFSLDFVPRRPVVFLNLYNNQWNTNYRYWYPGTWSSRVRIWPSTNLAVPSLEARTPLFAAVADGPAGKLPPRQAGLTVSRPGTPVTAYTPSLLRVWEQAGVAGQVVITGLKSTSATPVNLRGEKTGELIKLTGGALKFNLPAFAPASFVLE
jgi:hypothetical protein